jgi:arylsulfatase A-like enzyme
MATDIDQKRMENEKEAGDSLPAVLDRRQFLGFFGAAASTPLFARAASRPPNILYIMADDHASSAISAYGSRINRTPNIDRLARKGIRLTNCFCTNSICTPSRAAILTGQYSNENGVYTLDDTLDGSRDNVAKELQKSGYQTAIIGKWHLKSDPTGFDYWNILPGQGVYYNPKFIEMGVHKQHQGYCTDLIADFTIDWLKRRDQKRPFFLMCHHKAPHRPWDPPAKYKNFFADSTIPEPTNLYDHYKGKVESVANVTMKVGENMNKRDLKVDKPEGLTGDALRKWGYQVFIRDYLRCVQSLDDNVGRVLDYLDAENLTDNTVVIYTSDQGFFLGDHGFFDKRLMYEESLRMPFLVQYPGAIKPQSINNDIILNIDFAPTFLDYAGAKEPAQMQGHSFRSNLEGHTSSDWRAGMYYRLWMHNDSSHHVPAHYGVRTKRYKLIYYYGKPLGMRGANPPPTKPGWEFYDLQSDPHEMNNLYGDPKYAETVKKLKIMLDRLQKEAKDKPA